MSSEASTPASFADKNFFDTSDLFHPETIERIWQNTIGRPSVYPKLEPLPDEPDIVTSGTDVDYEILDIPLEIGREAVCVDPYGNVLKKGDRAIIDKISTDGNATWTITYSTGATKVGDQRSSYLSRWRHFNVKPKVPVDDYFFAKPKKYTREQIDNMWKNTQDLSQG